MFQILTFPFLTTEEVVSCCDYLERIKFLFLHFQASSATMVALLNKETFRCTVTWVAVHALFVLVQVFLIYCSIVRFCTLKFHCDNVGLYILLFSSLNIDCDQGRRYKKCIFITAARITVYHFTGKILLLFKCPPSLFIIITFEYS